ncbi:MAG: ABC transporter ATP-binding protein/permease [Alistipes sp.]|nr:ABC transporter ATP-binding protein/permease [Alistipes sp.]
MLQLKNVVKKYGSGENVVTALNGVSINFRENEFVAILGHSGCGKTTMLNIIGGLDQYTSGDLIINGISTKKYKDRDWDAYRNHSIGFVFQSYNLIPHQSVLANVELALTISGISKSERKKRAKEALEKVGLGNQLHKKPNQMSGGQMQRVAIARALINNPDILLADEPTGALDSETSIQVMELLKEVAKDKLVIMVTHNPELAEDYANRIVKVKDGKVLDDSNPCSDEEAAEIMASKPKEEQTGKKKRVSMSFPTAVSLSLNNLLTKKGRTFLTAFAGSIGIIGIATILSLSTGINNYINDIQEETLSSYPLQINRENADASGMLNAMMENQQAQENKEFADDKLYANTMVYDMFNSINSSAKQINNMKDFKAFLDTDEQIAEYSTALHYTYDIPMNVYTETPDGEIIKVDFMNLYADAFGMNDNPMMSQMMGGSDMSSQMKAMGFNVMEEMMPNEDGTGVHEMVKSQYELVKGEWPDSYDEVVVVLTENNEIPDFILFAMGLKDPEMFSQHIQDVMSDTSIADYGQTEWELDDIMNKKFKMILPYETYQYTEGSSSCTDLAATDTGMDYLYTSNDVGTELKIVGFIRPSEDAKGRMISSYVGYTAELTEYAINKTNESALVKAQASDTENDLITGTKFMTDDYVEPTPEEKAQIAKDFIAAASNDKKAEIYRFAMSQPDPSQTQMQVDMMMEEFDKDEFIKQIEEVYAAEYGIDASQIKGYLDSMTDEQVVEFAREAVAAQIVQEYAMQVQAQLAPMTNEELAAALDKAKLTTDVYALVCDEFTPQEISDYTHEDIMKQLGVADMTDPSSVNIYTNSFENKDEISDAIERYNKGKAEEDVIHYTDMVALLMSSITAIISGISYLLIAFVGISLVVSSIMIGIITYISVLERTREIGILRAIGASKHNVSTVFNAETLLVGLCAGLIGIGATLLLNIPINLIIHTLTDLDGLSSTLPAAGAVILVAISMLLTFIAGLIPSGVAKRKDPVEALRSE